MRLFDEISPERLQHEGLVLMPMHPVTDSQLAALERWPRDGARENVKEAAALQEYAQHRHEPTSAQIAEIRRSDTGDR